MADVAINRFLGDVDFSRDPKARKEFQRVADLLRAHGVDPATIPGLGDVINRLQAP